MVKVAYCIICHKNSNILRTCIELLKENDIYIHVDAKSKIKDFQEYLGKVYFLEKRLEVKWGHFSLVQVMLNLLEKTFEKKYNYISIISGDDLPLKSDIQIKKFLFQNLGKEFIGVQKLDKVERLMYNHYIFKKYTQMNYLEKSLFIIANKLKIKNKNYKKLPTLYKGAQWFTITDKCRDYIFEYLKYNKEFIDFFKKGFSVDEIFFQTIIFNSKFKNNIYTINNSYESSMGFGALRYIDWKTGPEYPKVLSKEDYIKMLKSNCLFARKISNSIDIEEYIKFFNLI